MSVLNVLPVATRKRSSFFIMYRRPNSETEHKQLCVRHFVGMTNKITFKIQNVPKSPMNNLKGQTKQEPMSISGSLLASWKI